MGYSHYWTVAKDSSEVQIQNMVKFTRKAIVIFGSDEIAGSMGDPGTVPVINNKDIAFNGVGDLSHETFHIKFNSGKRDFCKTRLKPYDALVVACLIYAEQIGIVERWGSDGDYNDHINGLNLYAVTMAKMI